MHRAPEYEWSEARKKWVVKRRRYFPLVKPCVAFAKEQAKKRGFRSYVYESLSREEVADMLTELQP